MINVLELDDPFLCQTSWSWLRVIGSAHGTLLRILNCTYPRVLSFRERGSAFPWRLPSKFTSRSCVHFLRRMPGKKAPLKDRSARLSNTQFSCSLVVTVVFNF